jgi:hypothetical protein
MACGRNLCFPYFRHLDGASSAFRRDRGYRSVCKAIIALSILLFLAKCRMLNGAKCCESTIEAFASVARFLI